MLRTVIREMVQNACGDPEVVTRSFGVWLRSGGAARLAVSEGATQEADDEKPMELMQKLADPWVNSTEVRTGQADLESIGRALVAIINEEVAHYMSCIAKQTPR